MGGHVRYATTADGIRIAFTVTGTGAPLVYMPPIPFRHVELEWQLPEDRRWLERLGRDRMLVGYDPRGLGLSDRVMPSRDLDAAVRDLDAVLDAVGGGPVALLAALNSAPLAITYAARRPERATHLVLWCASPRAAATLSPQIATLVDLIEKDWELVTEAVAHVLVGWGAGEAAPRYARFLRACITPEAARALFASRDTFDATPLLSAVRVPTLVLHRRDVTWVPLAHATELAAGIAGARLVIVEGTSLRPGSGDLEAVARTVDEFLSPGRENAFVTSHSEAAMSSASNVFRREGDYWTLAFEGTLCRLRDAKGLRHIARLLREPGRAVPAAELLVDAQPSATPGREDGLTVGGLGDAGEILDPRAKGAYRTRVRELRAEIADAEQCNDRARATAAETELDFVMRELAAATGLGGRDRKAASAAERARLAVTKRIKDALARIRVHHPVLGEHLSHAVRTGYLCAYVPPHDHAVRWEL